MNDITTSLSQFSDRLLDACRVNGEEHRYEAFLKEGWEFEPERRYESFMTKRDLIRGLKNAKKV